MIKTLTFGFDKDSDFHPLSYPYNKRFSDHLKFGIFPISYRIWDNTKSRWKVHVSKIPETVIIAKRYFDYIDYSALPEEIQIEIVECVEKHNKRKYKQQKIKKDVVSSPHESLFVLKTAPHEVIRAAYKALAIKYHPDHGGDPKKFREIQEAWEKLK